MITEVLPTILRKLREERNWTQEDLAKASGVSRRTISRYEWGGVEPRPQSLIKLADALRCTLNYLMTGRESPYPERRDGRRHGASKRR